MRTKKGKKVSMQQSAKMAEMAVKIGTLFSDSLKGLSPLQFLFSVMVGDRAEENRRHLCFPKASFFSHSSLAFSRGCHVLLWLIF